MEYRNLITGAFNFITAVSAAGADKVHFDLFNGSTDALWLHSLRAIKDGSVAVTGTLGVKLFLTRTSVIGTGGTAFVNESATLTASVLSALNSKAASVPTGLTGRLAPSGGATAGALLRGLNVFTEETNGATYEPLEFLSCPIVLPVNTGIRVVQGAVASVGNLIFDGLLSRGD